MKKIEQLPFRQQASCKLIYIAICSLSAKQGNSEEVSGWLSQIASFASVCDKTVQRYLPALKSAGIIDYQPQDRKSNGKYDKVVVWLVDNTLAVGHLQESCKKVARKQVPSTVRYINKEYKANKEIQIPPTTSPKKTDERFEEFWKQYPNKKGKQEALRKWLTLTEEQKDGAIKVLPAHINCEQWQRDGGRFIPFPATWLNQGRWEDEIKLIGYAEYGPEFAALSFSNREIILRRIKNYITTFVQQPTVEQINHWIKTEL